MMTLKELYTAVDGDYDQALRVLRMDKLLDKHIRKLPANPIFSELEKAGDPLNAAALFECAHAIKGVCSNLGLTKIAALASDISEEFRPGNERKLTDDEVREKLAEIRALYAKTAAGIRQYEQTTV